MPASNVLYSEEGDGAGSRLMSSFHVKRSWAGIDEHDRWRAERA